MNQTILHVQHTPNPDAQDPPLVPPLLEHSSLKLLIDLIYKTTVFISFFVNFKRSINFESKNSHQRIRIDNLRKNKTIIEL